MKPGIKLGLLVVLAALIGTVGMLLGKSEPEQLETLRVGAYAGDVGALAWIAQEQGFFAQARLRVDMTGFDTGRGSVDALRKGEVDIAMASEFVVADRSFAETDLRILASVCQYWNKDLIARRDHGIVKPTDLRGKRIGVTFTSTAEHSLVVFLALQGLTANDVQLIDLPPARLIEQIASGGIDAAMTWQPHAGKIEQQLATVAVRLLPRGADAYLVTLTRESLVADKGEAMQRFMRALLMAEEWVQVDPARAKTWMARRFSLEPAYVDKIWPDMRLAVTLPQEILEIMDGEARWLARRRDQPTPPDFAHILHAVPLSTVRPAAVTVF